ncbi:MAG: SDR family oxidoreductase [Planctomycetota bacterium]|jgi:pteridine reductase
MTLTGKTALITGAAKRVGRAIALELAEAGCDIAAHCHTSRDEGSALRDRIIAAGRRCAVITGDLAETDTPARLIGATVEALGRLDILVNSAAVFGRMSLGDFDLDAWQRTMQVNLTAVAALCHHAQPHLADHAAGKIVNLCDISADRPWTDHLAYCVSKAGLVCLSKALARELAPSVQVNGVSPGIAVFPDDYDQSTRHRLVAKVPLGRPGTPEDIASAVRFLVEHGDYITGQIINVDGGRSIV